VRFYKIIQEGSGVLSMEKINKTVMLTQKKIAEDLGISIVTVNRALKNSSCVSEAMKNRILQYVKENNYIPHRASQVLLRNKMRTIAVFSSSEPEYFWEDVNKGILLAKEQIRPFNYDVRYHRIPDFNNEIYESVLTSEINSGVDAIALVCQRIFDMKAIISKIEKAGVPYIFFNIDDKKYKRIAYVGVVYRSCGNLVANVLGKALACNSKSKILVICYYHDNKRQGISPDRDRLAGFMDSMERMYPAIKLYIECVTPGSGKPTEEQVYSFLKTHRNKVDGIFFNLSLHSSYLKYLEDISYRRSFTIKTDVDDFTLEALNEGYLSVAVYQDPVAQGYLAMRFLENILEKNIREKQEDIEICHNVIYKENMGILYRRRAVQDIDLYNF
jgi:LacI family transcriptional regulator